MFWSCSSGAVGRQTAVSSEGSQSYPRTCQQFAYPRLDTCQLPAQLARCSTIYNAAQYSVCLVYFCRRNCTRWPPKLIFAWNQIIYCNRSAVVTFVNNGWRQAHVEWWGGLTIDNFHFRYTSKNEKCWWARVSRFQQCYRITWKNKWMYLCV